MKMNIPIIDKVTHRLSVEPTLGFQYKSKSGFPICLIYIALITLLFITVVSSVCLIALYSRSVTVEVGETPDYSHITSNGIVSLFCKIDTDISSVDTTKPTETEIPN